MKNAHKSYLNLLSVHCSLSLFRLRASSFVPWLMGSGMLSYSLHLVISYRFCSSVRDKEAALSVCTAYLL